jgi:hypothetical protein
MMNRQAPMQAVDQLGTTLSGIIENRGKRDFNQYITQALVGADEITMDTIKPLMQKFPDHAQEIMKLGATISSQKEAQDMKDMGKALHSLIANSEDLSSLKDPKGLMAAVDKLPWKNDAQKTKFITSGMGLKAMEWAKKDREEQRKEKEFDRGAWKKNEELGYVNLDDPTKTIKGEAKPEENNISMTSPDRKTKVKVKESEVKAYEDKGYMRGEPTALDSKSEEPYKAGHVQQFDVGDRIVYKKYLGNGEWEDIKGVGGPRYKPTSGAPAEDKAAKKETNATIRALEKDLANRDAYLRRMQKIVDDPMKSGAEKKIAQQNIETTYERKEKVQTLINDVRDGVVNKVKWGGNSEQQPQQDLTQLVTEARQAIAKGAPKDKVLQRLRGMGYKGNL